MRASHQRGLAKPDFTSALLDRGRASKRTGPAVRAGLLALLAATGCRGSSHPAAAPVPIAAPPRQTSAVLSSPEAGSLLARLRSRFNSPAVSGAAGAGAVAGGGSVFPDGLASGFSTSEGRELRPTFAAGARPAPAGIFFSDRAAGAFRLQNTAFGTSVNVTLEGARDVAAATADGYVVYGRGHASGATVLHRPLPEGTEDFVVFEERPSAAEIAYKVDVGTGVGGLRLVAGTLELLDAQGAPRLRVSPPYMVGTDGRRTDATLAVRGCAFDQNPAPPWDRPVTAAGAPSCRVVVTWNDENVAYPAVLDPRWTTTGSMTVARQDHTATMLSTGKVLVAGGRSTSTGTTGLATAELFDPTTGTWAATASMTGGRWMHSATQLATSANSTTSGKVLIAGGINGTASLSTAQLYAPAAGTWAAAASLNSPRHQHTATVMANGKVLCVGGMNGTTVLATASIYNPATSNGAWTAVATNMSSARRFHSASLLTSSNPNFSNKVLIAGGNSGGTTSLTTAQLFDPTALTWSTTTALPVAREGHTATTLSNGKILVIGGKSGATTLASTLAFTLPASGTAATWPSAGTLTAARTAHTATLLPSSVVASGKVLVAGGSSGTVSLASAELWDGASTWAAATALPAAVQGHTATVLTNNAVLIAGGLSGTTTVNAAQIYDPSLGLGCTSNSQCSSGFCVGGICCDSACTGACGSCNLAGSVGTCKPVADSTACNDGDACTLGETCQVGVCKTGPGTTCTTGNSVSFYVGYEHGYVADITSGSTTPANTWLPFVGAPGLFGNAIDSRSESDVGYGDAGGIDANLTKPGSASFWFKSNDGHLPNGFAIYDAYAAANLYIVETVGSQVGVNLAYAAPDGTPGWYAVGYVPVLPRFDDGRWHLVVVNWSPGAISISADGNTPSVFAVGWFAPGHRFHPNPVSNGATIYTGGSNAPGAPATYSGAVDEVIVLNRPMSSAEIQWYWAQRASGGPTATNPAIAHFNAVPTACNQWDDLNPCTNDACTPAAGETHAAVAPGTSCSDSNVCDGAEVCNGSGTCLAGAPLVVDDGNPCTADSCDLVAGAVHTAVMDGAPCSDGNACTQADVCQGGICRAGVSVSCVASDACHTAGTCDPATGACSNPATGTPSCQNAPPPTTAGQNAESSVGGTLVQLLAINWDTGLPATGTPLNGNLMPSPVPLDPIPALVGTTPECSIDMNGDGTPDVVFLDATHTKLAFLGRSDSFLPTWNAAPGILDAAVPAGAPGPAACGDVNGDGRNDVVMSFGNTVIAYLSHSNPLEADLFSRLTLPVNLGAAGVTIGGKVLADFNGDGRPDLAIYAANNSNVLATQIVVFPNTGATPFFSSAQQIALASTNVLATPTGPNWGAVTTFQSDGDDLPGIWALGNRGALFLYRSLGNFSFSDPQYGGHLNPYPVFTLGSMDGNGDGIPDLVMTNAGIVQTTAPPAAPPPGAPPYQPEPGTSLVVIGAGAGVLADPASRPPLVAPAGALAFAPTVFHPIVHATSDSIGLVKESPVATTYTDARGVAQPSVFMQSVSGHLVERVRRSKVTTVLSNAPQPPVQLLPPLGSVGCISTLCDSPAGVLTPSITASETTSDVWMWVDHGTPSRGTPSSKTIVASKPAVAVLEAGTSVVREIFVRGLDGRLWRLEQHNGTETWIDGGLPPGPAGADPNVSHGAQAPYVGSPSVVTANSVTTPDPAGTEPLKVARGYMLDAAGHLDQFLVYFAPGSAGASWDRTFSLGPIGQGNCFGSVGHLGEGSPKAVTWIDPTGLRHDEVFMVSATGDLFGWYDGYWEKSFSSYRTSPQAVLGSPGSCLNRDPTTCPAVTVHICPNDPAGTADAGMIYNYAPSYTAPAQVKGTVDAQVTFVGSSWPSRGAQYRRVVGRGVDKTKLLLYLDSATAHTPASVSAAPAVTFTTATRVPQNMLAAVDVAPASPSSTLTSDFCNPLASKKPGEFFASDPTLVVDPSGSVSILETNEIDVLVIAHLGSLFSSWEYRPLDFRDLVDNMGRQIPSAILHATALPGPGSLDIFATRSDGSLLEGHDQYVSGLWRTASPPAPLCSPPASSQDVVSFAWSTAGGRSIHMPADAPHIMAGGDAKLQGCTDNVTAVDSIFPQWVNVEGQRSALAWRPVLYGPDYTGLVGPPQNHQGYNSETLKEIEGVVVASFVSAIDNPADHTHEANATSWPQVRHDWNIDVAVDPQYQALLSDGNIIGGGTMELEWEIGDHLENGNQVVGTTGTFTADQVPAVGDRVAVRGRHIFDCGHPPYHTEIHPIDAIAVIHGQQGRVVFSTVGGTTWYAHTDRNLLPPPQDEHPQMTLTELTSGQGWSDLLFLGTCNRHFDMSQVTPDKGTYYEYAHAMVDPVTDTPDNAPYPAFQINVPLTFDVAGSAIVGVIGSPSIDSMAVCDAAANVCHVTIPASAMPVVPATVLFSTKTSSAGQRQFDVCFTRTALRGHDDTSNAAVAGMVIDASLDKISGAIDGHWYSSFVTGLVDAAALPAVLAGAGLAYLGCSNDDHQDEMVTYISANRATQLYSGGKQCMTVTVEADETLTIGAHGFECDLSCAEHWDDIFTEASDDRIGSIRLAFDASNNWGAPATIGTSATYTVLSQPDLSTVKSSSLSAGDYKMTIEITGR